MKTSLVMHMTPIGHRTTIASTRIATVLAEALDTDIMDRAIEKYEDQDFQNHLRTHEYDVVFLVNSPSAFCGFIDDLVAVCGRAKKIVWVMNDYKIYPPTQLRRLLYSRSQKLELWGTLPEIPGRFLNLKAYGNLPRTATRVLNWNALTYMPIPLRAPSRNGLIYWGAFRHEASRGSEGRRDYFRRFLNDSLATISTTKKGQEKFHEICPKAQVIDPLEDLVWEIQSWPATLYIEDRFSHDVFCQPANRFYEALSARIAIYFERHVAKTLEIAGFTVTKELGLIDDSEELYRRVTRDPISVAEAQREAWSRVDYRDQLLGLLRFALRDEELI